MPQWNEKVMRQEQTNSCQWPRNLEQNSGGEPGAKRTLKLGTLVSSLLQLRPSPCFNCGIGVIRSEPFVGALWR
jgi:hypothetical protein